VEWKRELVIHDLVKERENSCRMEVLHKSREKALRAEIVELKDKVLEQELHNNYLSSKLLEYYRSSRRRRRSMPSPGVACKITAMP
jgi:hypothetical protein